ncbi:hypothetical protein C8R43DRAFT_1022379 [Mycena crocata]|nr:hypothetical protein C8R43DRAFT_1022379 [Mycena crocata]
MQTESLLKQLRTGHVPTQPEIEVVQADLISMSNELVRLETLIRDLSGQRDKIKESIDMHKALLAPVRRLPDDVVQDIFFACLPTHSNAVMSTKEGPLLLCRVCSIWRALALGAPRLWASLHVPLAFILQSEQRARAFGHWLKRAAGCPLSLSVCGTPSGVEPGNTDSILPPADSMMDNIIRDVLVQSTARWHKVSLTDLPSSYLQECRNTSTPLLQVIRIKDHGPVTQWIDVFGSSGVHTLSLEVAITDEDVPLILPALSSVLHLSISSNTNGPWGPFGIPASLTRGIITQLTQLVSLKIILSEVGPISGDTTHFPDLESLEMRGGQVTLGVFQNLLEHMVMPRLRHLRVDSPIMPDSNAPFFSSLRAHAPLLRSLELDLTGFTRDSLRGTLSQLTPLTRLSVRDSSGWHPDPLLPLADTQHLLTLLCQPEFAELRHLDISYSRGVEEETLFAFLDTRVQAGGEFHMKVDLNYSNNPTTPDVERFRAKGLDISLIRNTKFWTAPTPDAWTGLPRTRELWHY